MQGVLSAVAGTQRKHNDRYWQCHLMKIDIPRDWGIQGMRIFRRIAALDVSVERSQLMQRNIDEREKMRKRKS